MSETKKQTWHEVQKKKRNSELTEIKKQNKLDIEQAKKEKQQNN